MPALRFLRPLALLVVSLLLRAPAFAQQDADPKPFDELVTGAERVDGLIPLYRTKKNDLYLELTPALLEPGRLFHLQVTNAAGMGGEVGRVTVGDPAYDVVFSFQKIRDLVLVQVKQTSFRADPSRPIARAVARSFSDSVLAALKVESLPQPERQSILVKATDLFVSDVPGFAEYFSAVLSRPFTFDKSRSYLGELKAFPENAEIEVLLHFSATRSALNDALPDPRSIPVKLRYSILALKESGYVPRRYDSRVGYFTAGFIDLADDDPKETTTRYIVRWDLRRRPLVFWLDNAIPTEYRAAVAEGILSWNQAFEAIGLGKPIEVRQLGDAEEIDPFDIRYNVVRWVASTGDAYAIALPRVNPFTGEILKADIRIDASFVGVQKTAFRLEDELKARTAGPPPRPQEGLRRLEGLRCELGRKAVREAAFALAVRETEGIAPGDRARFVRQLVAEVVAHEFGHVLGLRHNFKGSLYRDPQTGLGASLMDYAPARIAALGQPQGDYFLTAPGPYDRWAIAYGYGAGDDPAALAKVASQAADPAHAYAPDEETADFGFAPFAPDPLAGRFDLGADPIAFSKERGKLIAALVPRLLSQAKPEESWDEVRKRADLLLGEYLFGFDRATRFIGGVVLTRARKGDPMAPALPAAVVPAAKQREALAYLRDGLFAANPLPLAPALLSALYVERNAPFVGVSEVFPNEALLPVYEAFRIQRRFTIRWLLTPGLLARMRDNEMRALAPGATLSVAELLSTLTEGIFAELKTPAAPIPVARRETQRELADALIDLYLRGGDRAPSDAVALARWHLRKIVAEAAARLAQTADATTRAHLELLNERIQRALRAQTVAD